MKKIITPILATLLITACNNGYNSSNQSNSLNNANHLVELTTSEISSEAQQIVNNIQQPSIPNTQCSISGLVGDGITINTQAIQSALDTCAKNGGGIVELYSADKNVYLTGPLKIGNNTNFRIPAGVTLLANESRETYQNGTSWTPIITTTKNGHDIAITGSGTIDGQGQPWWDYYLAVDGKGAPTNRPRMLAFSGVSRFLISDVTLKNSPSFFFVPTSSNNITVERIRIEAPGDSPNTDGVDPSNSNNVVVRYSYIQNGDDNIAIKAGASGADTYNIVIYNNKFLTGHGASIGSETNSGVHDVYFENIYMEGTENGIRIKSYDGKGGEVKNIHYNNFVMNNVSNMIVLNEYYQYFPGIPPSGTPAGTFISGQSPLFHDIYINNVVGYGPSAGNIIGTPEGSLYNIYLNNVNLWINSNSNLLIRNANVFTHNYKLVGNPISTEPWNIQENVNISKY